MEQDKKLKELRRKAEDILSRTSGENSELSAVELQGLIHNLSVYQIELELQNEELRASQQQAESARDGYARLYNQAPVGYLTINHQGTIQQSNQTFADMVGVEASALAGTQLAVYMQEADRKAFLGRFNTFYRFPRGKSIDLRFQTHRGDLFWGRIRGREEPVNPITGRLEGKQSPLLVTVSDITENIMVEDALRKSEERLNLVFKGTDEGLWDWDLISNERFYSPRWWAMLGYTPGEFPMDNHLWQRLMHPDDRDRANKVLATALGSNADHYEIEIRFLHKDGHHVPILTRGFILRDEQGKPVRLSGTNMDLSEHKRIENELRQSEERLMQAQVVAHLGNWELDLVSQKIWGSPEAFRIYGLERISPYLPYEIVRQARFPEDQARMDQALKDFMQGNKPYDIEYRILRPGENTPRMVHSMANLVKDTNGNPIKAEGVVQDITDRKEAEEKILKLNLTLEQRVKDRTAQLELANKDLASISYSIAHDLRTPLRALNGFSHALREEFNQQLTPTGADYLRRIIDASNHMERLLEGLLTLLQISRVELKERELDLASMAKQSYRELMVLYPERKVEFICHPELSAYADPKLLAIAIDQLMENAWKFTKGSKPAQIEFGSTLQNDKTVFFMRDNGIGFDMAYAKKLFGVFDRLHAKNDFGGTGIGLAMVKRVIDRHNGAIWAESVINQGATFYFTLE